MKRVLVTGATGFVGRPACELLSNLGFEVHGVSRNAGIDVPGVTTMHTVNLLVAGAPTSVIQSVQPSHLLHLAWDTPRNQQWMGLEHFPWVAASLELYRAFVEQEGQRAVFAGSCAEYDWNYHLLHEVETPAQPSNLYGAAKNAVQQLVAMVARDTSTSTAWARIFFLYGPHERPGRLVSDVCNALLEGRVIETTHGEQERDFLHVVDAARALVALVNSNVDGTFNVASGRCVPVREVIQILGKLTGRPELLAIGARPIASIEPQRVAADIGRLSKELGFVARYRLDEGLAATLDWWRAHGLAR